MYKRVGIPLGIGGAVILALAIIPADMTAKLFGIQPREAVAASGADKILGHDYEVSGGRYADIFVRQFRTPDGLKCVITKSDGIAMSCDWPQPK